MSGINRNKWTLAGIAVAAAWMAVGCMGNLPSRVNSETPIASTEGLNTVAGEVAAADVSGNMGGVAGDTGLGASINPDTLIIPPGTTFDNPWRYCEAVRTIDSPGMEYVGEKPPSAVRTMTLRMAGIPENEGSSHSIVWRCMDEAVYGCDVTLSTHCLTKLTLLSEPTRAMIDECTRLEEGTVLPMAVTGPETPYEWTCVSQKPTITGQGVTVDSQGFNANIWYRIYEN